MAVGFIIGTDALLPGICFSWPLGGWVTAENAEYLVTVDLGGPKK